MKTKNITLFYSQSHFLPIQLERLAGLGKATFSGSALSKVPRDTEVLVFNPESAGEAKAKSRLLQILDTLPYVKYLVLESSDCSFVDFDYCREKNIIVSYVPFYDAESKAEHEIALLLSCCRRIVINDRSTYRRRYYPEPGHNFKGSVLGVIGLDHTGELVTELAKALSAVVYASNEKITHLEGVQRKTLDTLLNNSDMVVLHLPDGKEYKKFLNREKIKRLKEGSIVVNTGNREWVDERAMNEALTSRQIATYCFEADAIGKSPLKGNDYALMFKPFGSYTKETLEKNREAMVKNIEGIVRGMPYNSVKL